MSDFVPYDDSEIVTFGLIPKGLATFRVMEARDRADTGKGRSIEMKIDAKGSGVSSTIRFFLHPKMMLTFKHFYQAAGMMSLFDIGVLPSADQCVGIEGECIVDIEIGKEIKDKPGQFWFDKNVINDFLYPGYDPRKNGKREPKPDTRTEAEKDECPFD